MQLSPKIYHWFVRPAWFSNRYIYQNLKANFNFHYKKVLDFGCGIGSSCPMFHIDYYMGVDCDSKRIQYAKRLYPDYNFRILQEHTLPLPDNTMDYILIVSVLHHIPPEELSYFLKEFQRVLKPYGKIIIIEPCFCEKARFCNLFMRTFDKGRYIRNEEEYVNVFKDCNYQTKIIRKFKQLLFYNKLLFSATFK